MDTSTTDFAIKVFLKEMRQLLEETVGIAKAAEACAEAGNVEKGVEVSHDVEQLTFDANRLLNAASLLNRLSKDC